MKEEEKKAVERLEDIFYQDLGKGINKFQKITLYEDSIADIRTLLNLIETQKAEIEKKNKIIYLMASYIAQLDIDEDICSTVGTKDCDKMAFCECESCIIECFTKSAEEEK